MVKLNKNGNLKLAIQKEGRLTSVTIEFLRKTGLEFEADKRRLYSKCQNFPMEVLFVRDDDIPDYVEAGAVELGIVGQNVVYEKRSYVQELLPLDFAYCSLVVAVPKESSIENINDLKNKTVATAYPRSTIAFFQKKSIPIRVFEISGSAEIAPALGVADAVVDITSTGSTLKLNGLKPIWTIYDSQATLIANKMALKDRKTSKKIVLLWKMVVQLDKFAKKICRSAYKFRRVNY